MGLRLEVLLLSGLLFTGCVESADPTDMNTKENIGKVFYEERCIQCHGVSGDDRLAGAADLKNSSLSDDSIRLVIKDGKNGMPPFKSWIETDSLLSETVNYVKSLRK